MISAKKEVLERVGSPDVVIFVLQEPPNVIFGKEFIIQRKVTEDGVLELNSVMRCSSGRLAKRIFRGNWHRFTALEMALRSKSAHSSSPSMRMRYGSDDDAGLPAR